MKIQAQALLLGITSAVVWGVNVAPGYAINLIGNLPQTNDLTTIGTLSSSGTNVRAVSFTLPTGTNYFLQNAVLRLTGYDSADVLRVQIRNDVGGLNPGGTILANLTVPTGLGAAITNNYTATPSTPTSLTLVQNTKYWLYATISSGSLTWLAPSPNVNPTGIATFGAYRFSSNGGTTFGASNITNSFEINATAVPFETDALPVIGSTVLFGLGLWAKTKLAQKKIANLK